MITTPDLIDALAADLMPVRRLRPLACASCWLFLAAVVLGLLAVGEGLRPDLTQKVHEAGFVIGILGMLATGILAAIAAFVLSLPDRSRLWLLLPAPALATWLATIGYQCLTHWVSVDPGGLRLGETAKCFATLVLASLPLSLALLGMLRHAAALRPAAATFAGSLAVAAMTAAALTLFHEFDASLMILVWNFGAAALVVGLGSVLGRELLSRSAPRLPAHPG